MTDRAAGTDRADDELRAEVRAWLDEHWDPAMPTPAWRELVVDAGYATPSWPREWLGLGLTSARARVVAEEFTRFGAPGAGQDIANLPGNVILVHGDDEQRARLLRPLVTGQWNWCLLYSEPGAGSDLAAVQTRAERDGDEWVVNGQKVWTSQAQTADYGLLIARTNWDVPKHRGATFFLFPMKQDGVEVRPIRQITGGSSFNEVFIDDARVADGNRLGDVDAGWGVLQTALAYERVLMGSSREIMAGIVGQRSRDDDGQVPSAGATDVPRELVELARATGRDRDPVARQAIARIHSLRAVNRWTSQRARADRRAGPSSATASIGKLAMSEILHGSAHVKAMLLGAEGMLEEPSSARAHQANLESMTAFVNSIGGGTDQVQRNIIGERVLGLPKEPQVDRDVPFRDVLKAPATRRFG